MTDSIRAALEAILGSAVRGSSAIPGRLTDAAWAALAAVPPEPEPVGELVRFPFTVEQLRDQWNAQADEFNQWESLGLDEQIDWAQARAAALIEQQAATIAALSAAPPEPEPVGEGLTDEELYCMASRFIDPYYTISPGEYEAETECALEVYGSELIAFARAVESAATALPLPQGEVQP